MCAITKPLLHARDCEQVDISICCFKDPSRGFSQILIKFTLSRGMKNLFILTRNPLHLNEPFNVLHTTLDTIELSKFLYLTLMKFGF